MSKEIYAIILAGGSDERLWPLCGMLHPNNTFAKQGEYTLFQQMFIKLIDCIDDKNIICTTDTQNTNFLEKQLKEMQEKFCRTTPYLTIEEPEARGTLSAVALSVKYIKEKIANQEEDPTIVVLPSDQIINGNFKLDYFLEKAKLLAEEGYIVCLGTNTKKPDQYSGYLSVRSDKKISQISKRAFKVSKFIEKPALDEAKKIIKSKNTFRNCGIYMFNASTFLSQLKSASSDTAKALKEIILRDTSPAVELKQYEMLKAGSIEKELMENSKKLTMISMNLDIKDCGYWEAVGEITSKDRNGNALIGDAVDLSSKNTFVYSSSRLVATMGLKDICVVETPETVFVCDKNNISKSKKLIQKLKTDSDNKHLINQTVVKPWGYYTVLQAGEGYLTKCIYVNPHSRLSLQTHNYRSEHWVVLKGQAKVIKGEQEFILNVSEGTDIKVKEPHSLQNPFDKPLKILEIQTGELLSEDDIIRLEDIYGRV